MTRQRAAAERHARRDPQLDSVIDVFIAWMSIVSCGVAGSDAMHEAMAIPMPQVDGRDVSRRVPQSIGAIRRLPRYRPGAQISAACE
jgi:hypothetical protein